MCINNMHILLCPFLNKHPKFNINIYLVPFWYTIFHDILLWPWILACAKKLLVHTRVCLCRKITLKFSFILWNYKEIFFWRPLNLLINSRKKFFWQFCPKMLARFFFIPDSKYIWSLKFTHDDMFPLLL